MSMSPRKFRTEQAIKAFESCLSCGTLPEEKITEVRAELGKAHGLLEKQDAEVRNANLMVDGSQIIIQRAVIIRLFKQTPMANLQNCAPS